MNPQTLVPGNLNRSVKRYIFSNLSQPDTVVNLTAGQGWGVKGRHPQQTLVCLQGRVWVTQECDIRDYLLDEGDAFLITQPGLMMVRALTPARIGFTENSAARPFKGRFSHAVFR